MADTSALAWMRTARGIDPNVDFAKINISWDIGAALEVLTHCGMPTPDDLMRNALLIGLAHESFVYEHQREIPGVTPGILNALVRLGSDFVARTAAVQYYLQRGFPGPGPLSNIIAVASSNIPIWAQSLSWVRSSVAISKGLDRTALPRKVTSNVLKQVIGVLCLTGNDHVANRLISDLLARSGKDPEGDAVDPRTRLHQILGSNRLDIEYDVTGPDHQRHFQATLTDARGRKSTGSGKNKKEAVRNASTEFLRRHLPREAEAERKGISPSFKGGRPNDIADSHSAWHVHTISRISEMFHLSQTNFPLLSQALIHSSWAYEHKEAMARSRQQDNQVLGLVGSHVLQYEQALRIARVVLVDKPKEFSFLTLDREPYERGFYHLGLTNALLLGFGQASQGIAPEMAANAFQAIMGAIYLSKGCPESLLDDWPPHLVRLREIVIPPESRSQDSATLLQEACAAAKIFADYSFRDSGPDHRKQYHATVRLRSENLGRHISIVSPTALHSKTAAKQEIATDVLEVFDALADVDSLGLLVTDGGRDTRMAIFLLAHLAVAVPDSEAGTRRWINAALFGTHLASDASLLIEWAKQADRLFSLRDIVIPDVAPLANLFSMAVRLSGDREGAGRKQLRYILRWLDSLRGPEQIGANDILCLIQICDFYRAIGTSEPDTDLRTIFEEWRILYADTVTVEGVLPTYRVDCIQRAALHALIGVLREISHNLEIQFIEERPLRGRLVIEVESERSEFLSEVCELWSSASPMLKVRRKDQCVDVTLQVAPDSSESGRVESAVLAALRPAPAPFSSAVASLLHDMKNQLIAALQALQSPAGGRTARLAREASASSHLDQAVAIGRRLGAVSSLLGPPGSDTTELGSFIRRYSEGLLRRLPPTVSLTVPPAGASRVEIALDEASVSAILDNLVNNAIEAMPNGGSVRLDWTADGVDAVIEVADDGPGLPEQIVHALESAGRITSTKVGGNGVGLLSVRTLLRRAGGDLTVLSGPSGTAWMVVIPCARIEGA